MPLKETVLDLALAHWSQNFTGISALSLSEATGHSHEEILSVLDELAEEGMGALRTNVTLYTSTLRCDTPGRLDYSDSQEVVTSIFFPARAVLQERYFQGDLCRQGLPEYIIRLHWGYSQIHLFYFTSSVLRKYLDHPEIYDVDDSVSGGMICPNTDFRERLADSDPGVQCFNMVRYGKRRLADSDTVVTAILNDLADMPPADQSYWHSHEVVEPTFASEDPDFERFFRASFEAECVDDPDPVNGVLNIVHSINELFDGTRLFTKELNPYLSYPVVNTHKNFCDSCVELHKIVGPDSLNQALLKRLLCQRLGFAEADLVNRDSGRKFSKLQLLELLEQRIADGSGLMLVIQEIGDNRVTAAHRIIEPQRTDRNYIDEFRSLCDALLESLVVLEKGLRQLL